jgi:hypothetical protein
MSSVKYYLMILTGLSLIISYLYLQLFHQDSPTTASSGIIFKKTLHLDKYQVVSDNFGLLGKYVNISRSDRHDEVISVYCNDYCK